VGLAIGFAASILIGLYVRDELTYDTFIPALERTTWSARPCPGGLQADHFGRDADHAGRAAQARLPGDRGGRAALAVLLPADGERGQITATEQNLFWGDPDLFKVLPLPVLAGDTRTALEPSTAW
jgi:putative ABC transport system permease protein